MEEKELKRIEKKRKREQRVVSEMIRFYCRKHHKGQEKGKLCTECQELTEYAMARSEHCPFMKNKTFCSNCKVHCYKPQMKEKIRKVMRYSGPRILFFHPFMATWHVITSSIEKKMLKKNENKKAKEK